jgi:hypothetical protein
MAMTSGLRKFALTTHVTSSVGWLGVLFELSVPLGRTAL